MIVRDPYWGAAEWFVVLLWKAVTLVMAALMIYLAVTGPQLSLHIVGAIYAPLSLAAFLFTQPGV